MEHEDIMWTPAPYDHYVEDVLNSGLATKEMELGETWYAIQDAVEEDLNV